MNKSSKRPRVTAQGEPPQLTPDGVDVSGNPFKIAADPNCIRSPKEVWEYLSRLRNADPGEGL